MKNLEYFYFKNLFFTKKWEWNGDSCNTINTTDGSPRARDHRMYQNLQTVDQHSVYKKILPFEIKEIVCYGLGPVDKLGSINQTWSHPILGDLAQTRNSIYQLSLLVLKPVLLLYYVCILVFSGRRTDVSKSRFTSNEEYCTSVHTCTFCEHNGVA